MQSPPSPILVDICGFKIHYYGLILFIAIITAIAVIRTIAKKYYKNTDFDIILDILPSIILCSILGARLYYVLMDFSYFSTHPSEIIAIWNGGMSIHGGIIGGILSGLIIAKIKKISFLLYADVFSYGLIIGQAIGRFGNYFNCEAFGKPCNIPFIKLHIPSEFRPTGYEHYDYFHPTFLYESIWNIAVFIILLLVVRKLKNIKTGTIFFSYMILYSIGRIFIEWCRMDSVLNIWGMPIAQIVSAIIIVLSGVTLAIINKKEKTGS